MIQLQQITLNRSQKTLLSNASLMLLPGQKVGLIGKNGSGKTSLLMMLQGELQPEEGEFSIPKNLKIAYIQQDIPQAETSTQTYVLYGDTLYASLSQQIIAAEKADDGMRLANLHMKMVELEGYRMPSKAAKILHGLGFSNEDLKKPIRTFSGGWQMRLNLARLLMDRADILLLDEPTNHLDLEAIVWLEDWLSASTQTIILISHDRDFIDNVVTHIAHLHDKQLKLYTGNYSQFETQRAQALKLQQAAYAKQQTQRKHLQHFIDRFRYKASKARQAQSRIKMLERMDDTMPVQMENPFRFEFKETKAAGNPMLTLENATVCYKNKIILKQINFSIRDGDRIGLLGKNGAGKSTLIKLISNELQPKDGKVCRSNKIKIGYFAQHQLDLLSPTANALNHIREIDQSISESRARQYLGSFHFSNDDVFREVGSFSGGEKSRLVLALIIWQRPNLLLLDEPTNHLDLEMREALNLALQDYTGALILVSHDRHLLNCTSNEFWLIANNKVEAFNGDLNQYQDSLSEPKKENLIAKEMVKPTPIKNVDSKIKKLETELETLANLFSKADEDLSKNEFYLPENKHELEKLSKKRNELKNKIAILEEKLLTLYK